MILGDVAPWRIWLIRLFVLLGPFGSLLTPYGFPRPFRAYYLLLPLFPLFFLKIGKRTLDVCLCFLPFFLYSFVSVAFLEIFGLQNEQDQFFRFCLLFCHVYFTLGAASQIVSYDQIRDLFALYFRSFFIVLGVGYLFFIGYYTDLIPLSFIERFSVLTQFGYGLLRFSPGSYPNEFGILCSFVLSVLILLIFSGQPLQPWGLSRLKLFLWIPLTVGALFLTTTRAAYISFAACFLYLFFQCSSKVKYLFLSGIAAVFLVLQRCGLSFSLSSFLQRIDEGSWGERYFVWLDAFHLFQEHRILGLGFSALSQLHNVYLSLFFELGILGSVILICSFGFYLLFFPPMQKEALFDTIRKIGLVHVFWFAASNHNLHHHLTWFIFFLCFYARSARTEILFFRGKKMFGEQSG